MIIINIEKAKKIGHDLRRKKRDMFFEPYDKTIELQIPNEEEKRSKAEEKRAVIRVNDSVCQTKINKAKTAEEIKAALNEFVD
jgi:hypothetical protein